MGKKEKIRVCAICKREFDITRPGRLKILRREKKGEKCIWICRDCAEKIKIM